MFTDDYQFTGPNIAISCTVEWNQEREVYVAQSDGFIAYSPHSAKSAALELFRARVTGEQAWYMPLLEAQDAS